MSDDITQRLALQMTKERERGWRDAIAYMGADPDLYTRMARVCVAARAVVESYNRAPGEFVGEEELAGLGEALAALGEAV